MRLAAFAATAALLVPGPQEPLATAVRFEGTPAQALAAIQRLSASEPERAIALARELGDDASLADPLRAEFRFAEGVVTAQLSPTAAVQPFLSARALAGPGELRDAATYDQGTAQLLHAEALREEAFRQMLDPAAAGAPSTVELRDPLAKPRAAYLLAKATLIERVRAPGDSAATADARANLELIQRRLAELEELEQPEEPEQEPQEGDQEEPEEGDEQEEEGEPGDEGEQQEPDEEGRDQPSPDEQDAPQEPDVGAPEEEQSIPDVGEIPEDVEASEPPLAEPAERRLSREEVLRLLDRLEELEAEREAIDAQLRAVRRVPVKEDW